MHDRGAPLLIDRHEDTVTLTLNRPRVVNAVDLGLLQALDEAADDLFEERPRAVILTAAAPGFCSGIDLKEAREASPAFIRHRVSLMHQVLGKLRRLPMPVIAAIDGVCIGLGCELAISADIRLATRASRFRYAEPAVAVPSPAHHLVWLIGLARAQELLLTARWMEAGEAERFGLVTRVVDEPKAEARAVAAEVAALAPAAVARTKENIWLATRPGIEAATAHHIDGVTAAAGTHDRLEALAAFDAKRPPRYTGT